MTNERHQPPCLLQTKGLTKRFGALIANKEIHLEVHRGTIHAILGENGAGKSTLMKMLYGVYQPDGGEIEIDGEPAVLYPPTKARAKGIGMVFQDFRVVPALTVLDNIALSVESGWLLKRKRLRQRIVDISAKYGLAVDPDAYVWQLDLGQRQRLEIVKVLLAPGTRIIIFDEPTSVLVPQEVESFLGMLRMLRGDGYGILLITHKINEVLAVADQVTVLRNGETTYSASREDGLDGETLIAAMMANKTLQTVTKPADGVGPHSCETGTTSMDEAPAPVLQLSDATIKGDHGEMILDRLSLKLHRGRITGVAGISGSGQRELAEVAFGLRRPAAGKLSVKGAELQGGPKAFMQAGVTFVSEDPIKESVIPGFTILEHMVLDGIDAPNRGLGLDWAYARERLEASSEGKALALAASSRRADTLSGGNVQRMVLTRALIRGPDILIISYPSRGLDIGTTRTIQQHLLELAAQGTAILLFSEDLDELFALSDDLVVLSGKRLLGPYPAADTDIAQIGSLMLEGESA
jgi:simple sugar transport system ATP-binding protein